MYLFVYKMVVVIFVMMFGLVVGDYECVCSYSTERTVYLQADTSSSTVGYMYEFDCKEYLPHDSNQSWLSIAIDHLIGYIINDVNVQITVCTGEPPAFDRLTSTKISTNPTTEPPPKTTPVTVKSTTKVSPTISLPIPNSTDSTDPTATISVIQTTSTPITTTITTTTATTQSTTSLATETSTLSSPEHTTIPNTVNTSSPTFHVTYTPSTSSSTVIHYTNVSTQSQQPTSESTTPQQTSTTTTLPTTQTTTVKASTTVDTSQAKRLCPQNVQAALSRDQGILILDVVHRKCFELVEFHSSWSNALSHCKQLGGKLVTIRSLDQNEILHTHVLNNYMHKTWIGLNDVTSTGHYGWSSGEAVTFTNWIQGNAQSSTSSGRCIVIEPSTGMWQGENCYWSYPYVCEFDIPREMSVVG